MQLQTTPLQICLKILSPANPFPGRPPGPHSQPISADILGMQPSYSVLYHNLHRTVNKTIFGTRMFVIPTCECGIERQVKTISPFYFALQIFLSSLSSYVCGLKILKNITLEILIGFVLSRSLPRYISDFFS